MQTLMKMDFKPVSSRIIRRIFGFTEIEKLAIERQVICEAEERPIPPAIYLEGQLEKITGVHEFSSGLKDEIRKAVCTKELHTETLAYRLKNVCLVNGQLCSHTHYKKLTFDNISLKPAIIRNTIEDAALCSTAAGNDYFAHFLYDDACTALMAKQFSLPVFANPGHNRTRHMLDYLALFGIKAQDIQTTHFNNLWIFKDIALNSHRCHRLRQLRSKLAKYKKQSSPTGVYLKRGGSGSLRNLSNENDVELALHNIGFEIINPEKLSVEELVSKINGSSIVVGVEGSQLVHGLLNLKPKGTLLCIQPPDRFNAIYRPFTEAVGLQWSFIVGDGSRNNFTISIADLLATIDKCYPVTG